MKIKMNIHHHFQSLTPRVLNPQRWLAAAKPKAVRLEVVAFSLLLLPVILVMADHLPFIDVPSSAFFHNAVSALYGARITTGTTPSTFSPDDFVTRGQMAVFLHRGLGRVAYELEDSLPLSLDYQEIALLRINTGGAAGGTGFLKVDAAFSAWNVSRGGCPCTIGFYLSADGGPSSMIYGVNLYDSPTNYISVASGAATMAFPLPTGNHPQNVRLWAKVLDNAISPIAALWARGSITALWVPFGATGGNTLSAASAEQGEAPQGPEPDGKPNTER